jgi:hypothetical protein
VAEPARMAVAVRKMRSKLREEPVGERVVIGMIWA